MKTPKKKKLSSEDLVETFKAQSERSASFIGLTYNTRPQVGQKFHCSM